MKRVPGFCMAYPKARKTRWFVAKIQEHVKRGGLSLKRVIADLSWDDLHTCLREQGALYAHSTQSLPGTAMKSDEIRLTFWPAARCHTCRSHNNLRSRNDATSTRMAGTSVVCMLLAP